MSSEMTRILPLMLLVSLLLTFSVNVKAAGVLKPAPAEVGAGINNSYSDVGVAITSDTPMLMLPMNDNKLLTQSDESVVFASLNRKMSERGYKVDIFDDFGDDKNSPAWKNYYILTSEGLIESPETNAVMKSLIQSFQLKKGIVIVPSVIPRITKLRDGVATWDDVSVTLRSMSGEPILNKNWNVKRPVYSIKLEIYNGEGEWLMDLYSGISLPLIVNDFTNQLEKKADLFLAEQDLSLLYEGIHHVLDKLGS